VDAFYFIVLTSWGIGGVTTARCGFAIQFTHYYYYYYYYYYFLLLLLKDKGPKPLTCHKTVKY